MKLMKWTLVLMLALIHSLAFAEFYRYVDDEGKVHYTDDLANVPADQRPNMYEYGGPDDELMPSERAEEEWEETGTLKEDEEIGLQKEALAKESLHRPLEELKGAGAGLQEEYTALMKEKMGLIKEIGEMEKAEATPSTRAAREDLKKRIEDYRVRSRDYDNRRKAFEKEVEAYNVEQEGEANLGQELKETAAKFEEEYESLVKEKEELDEAGKMRLDRAAYRKHTESIEDYEARRADYEKRKEEFDKKLDAYNARTEQKAEEPR
jgi:hypothetical protein